MNLLFFILQRNSIKAVISPFALLCMWVHVTCSSNHLTSFSDSLRLGEVPTPTPSLCTDFMRTTAFINVVLAQCTKTLALTYSIVWQSPGNCNSAVGKTAMVHCDVSHIVFSGTPAFHKGESSVSERLKCIMVEEFYGLS